MNGTRTGGTVTARHIATAAGASQAARPGNGTAARQGRTAASSHGQSPPAVSGDRSPHGRVQAAGPSGPDRDAGPAGPAAAEHTGRPASGPVRGPAVRAWPLWLLAAPAAAEVWSGWVGIGQMTGFGQVHPLPGIWDALHLDTAVTLPVGVEAYAAYALRACLSASPSIGRTARRFAGWSAALSLLLGMAGQVAYHLLAQSGRVRAPWAITTAVSCLPVLVLGMGAALAHLLREVPTRPGGPVPARPGDQPDSASDIPSRRLVPDGNSAKVLERSPGPRPPSGRAHQRQPESSGHADGSGDRFNACSPDQRRCLARRRGDGMPAVEARQAVARLRAEGKRVSRRNLRAAGMRGSNARLGALAQILAADSAASEP